MTAESFHGELVAEAFVAAHPATRAVLGDVAAERARQVLSGDFYNDYRPDEWADFIGSYNEWALQMAHIDDPEYRRRLVQVAALAVAAVESLDRQMGSTP